MALLTGPCFGTVKVAQGTFFIAQEHFASKTEAEWQRLIQSKNPQNYADLQALTLKRMAPEAGAEEDATAMRDVSEESYAEGGAGPAKKGRSPLL